MQKEFETQVLDVDVEKIKEKLRDLGAKEESEVLQKRLVFDIKCLDAIVPGTGEWIRLRQSGDKTTLTYKNRKGNGLSDTQEIEVKVDDFDKTSEILSNLSCFTGKYYQENKRIRFTLGNIEFTLDSWPMIPTFLEIESTSEEKVKKGLKLLGLEGKDAGHIGLIQIYRKYGKDIHAYKELKFKEE
jgi:adenylate cyclase class 2